MSGDTPERRTESVEIDQQHRHIMDSLTLLLAAASDTAVETTRKTFDDFSALVVAHFRDEEDVLARLGSDLLAVQRTEHAILSRMLAHMRGLMEASDEALWRAAVVGEAVDALAIHFAKEEQMFSPLLTRRRAKKGVSSDPNHRNL